MQSSDIFHTYFWHFCVVYHKIIGYLHQPLCFNARDEADILSGGVCIRSCREKWCMFSSLIDTWTCYHDILLLFSYKLNVAGVSPLIWLPKLILNLFDSSLLRRYKSLIVRDWVCLWASGLKDTGTICFPFSPLLLFVLASMNWLTCLECPLLRCCMSIPGSFGFFLFKLTQTLFMITYFRWSMDKSLEAELFILRTFLLASVGAFPSSKCLFHVSILPIQCELSAVLFLQQHDWFSR